MAITFLNHSKKKYLLLLPIVILLLNAFYFQYATKNIEDTILQEKYLETVNHVNMLAAAVEANETRFWLDHEKNIVDSVAFIDRLPLTFAATYKPVNGMHMLISERDDATNFDPRVYPEFREAVATQDNGKLHVRFTPANGRPRDMYLYFTHMPMYSPPEQRYLVVTAVSKYSVISSVPAWVSAGQWVSMIITFFLNMWLIVLVVRLGVVNEQRGADKQREEGGNRV